jgi:hypothetical protein
MLVSTESESRVEHREVLLNKAERRSSVLFAVARTAVYCHDIEKVARETQTSGSKQRLSQERDVSKEPYWANALTSRPRLTLQTRG